MTKHSTRPRGRTPNRGRVEHTPNGGWILRAGRFTVMDRAALDHRWETDPEARAWRLADELCDRRLLPWPELPVYDQCNRPGYPDGDPSLWTTEAAIKRYGRHSAC